MLALDVLVNEAGALSVTLSNGPGSGSRVHFVVSSVFRGSDFVDVR